MRVHVAFTPAETLSAPVAVVVDVLRATSTIAQALDGGYRRVLCCAGIDATRTDAAVAAGVLARAFPDAHAGLTARTYGPPGLEEDIAWCARENALVVVPRLGGMEGSAAEIVAS